MRRRCENCHKLSEDAALRWVGTNLGYMSLCDSCINDLSKGKLKVVKDPNGKLRISKVAKEHREKAQRGLF